MMHGPINIRLNYFIISLLFSPPYHQPSAHSSSLDLAAIFPPSLHHLPHLSLLFFNVSFSSFFPSYYIFRSSFKFPSCTYFDLSSYIPSNLDITLFLLRYYSLNHVLVSCNLLANQLTTYPQSKSNRILRYPKFQPATCPYREEDESNISPLILITGAPSIGYLCFYN